MDRFIYQREILNMVLSLEGTERERFLSEFSQVEQNPVALYGWNVWLGWLGIDRFIVGDILLGILKLLTMGSMGLWVLVDYFLIGNRTRTKNLEKARWIYQSITGKSG